MDIDKLYRALGTAFKRVFYKFVSRPVKNFNVESRAHKVIEKPKPAPWHETTKNLIEQIKKEHSFGESLDKRNDGLVERLKSVKVISTDIKEEEAFDDESQNKRKLPQERYGAELPYVFFKPEVVPKGKITILDALDILINHDKEQTSTDQIATQYSISEDDAKMIVKYFGVFTAVNKNDVEVPLYSLGSSEEESNVSENSLPPYSAAAKTVADK